MPASRIPPLIIAFALVATMPACTTYRTFDPKTGHLTAVLRTTADVVGPQALIEAPGMRIQGQMIENENPGSAIAPIALSVLGARVTH